jgi:hypothetical protein
MECGAFVYLCFLPAVVEGLRREVVWCHVIWKIIIFILIFKIECAIGWDPLNLERGLGRSLVLLYNKQ